MSLSELGHRPPKAREQGAALGAEFRLGELVDVAERRYFGPRGCLGVALVVAALGLGLPAGTGVMGSSVQPVLLVLAGVLAGTSVLLIVTGLRRAETRARVFWYSGGVAQLILGEPEPRVARWGEISEVTVSFHYESGDENSSGKWEFSGFAARTAAGTEVPGFRSMPHGKVRDLVARADGALAPRLLPALVAAHDAGHPILFGGVQVDQAGLTFPGRRETVIQVPWAQLTALQLRHEGRLGIVRQVTIRSTATRRGQDIGISGLPNGIFLARLLAHAAAQRGIPVKN